MYQNVPKGANQGLLGEPKSFLGKQYLFEALLEGPNVPLLGHFHQNPIILEPMSGHEGY